MIDIIETFLAEKGIYMMTFVLMGLGLLGMISCGNYMKKIMCMNILQVSIIFFFLALGQKEHGTLPVVVENLLGADAYINPLPHALMLTAIVVSLGTTGVALALLMKIKGIYGTIEEAVLAGYDLRTLTMRDASDAEITVGRTELEAMPDSYILITEDPSNIRGYQKVAYIGLNDTLVNEHEVDTDDGETMHYVIFK